MANEARLVTTERTLQYFTITMDGGDKGFFGEKLKEIIAQISPIDREYDYRNTWVNIEILKKDDSPYIRGTIRQLRDIAPSIRQKGKLVTTPVALQDDQGIDEKTHFIYCPDTSLICLEYNYHGPKIGLLANTVNTLYKDNIDRKAKRSSYDYVRANEAIDKVENTVEIRSVTAQLVDPTTTGMMNEDSDLPEAFAALKAPKNAKLEVVIRPQKQGAVAMATSEFRKWFLRRRSDLEYFDKLKVKITDDETGKPVEYDLVQDKLQEEVVVGLTPGTKEVSTSQMMEIMEDHITKVKEQYIINR